MIFSLSSEESPIIIPELSEVDVICFFQTQEGVKADASLWWEILLASLKRKHGVLLLEANLPSWPLWDSTTRISTGENWSWLAPRAMGVLSKAYSTSPTSFQDFKNFLTRSK